MEFNCSCLVATNNKMLTTQILWSIIVELVLVQFLPSYASISSILFLLDIGLSTSFLRHIGSLLNYYAIEIDLWRPRIIGSGIYQAIRMWHKMVKWHQLGTVLENVLFMGQRCLRSCYLWVLIEIPIQPSKSRQMSLFAVLSLYSMCLAKYVCNQNDADYGCRTTSHDDFMRMSIRNIGGHTHTEFTERKFFPCLLFWSFLCKTSFHFKKVLSYFIDQNTRLKNICFFFHWHSCWSISPHLHIATVKPFEFMQILLISKTDHFSFQSLNIHLLDLNASSVCLFICYVFFFVFSRKCLFQKENYGEWEHGDT